MADTSAGRLVSFLIEGDEVVSCEVCKEPFDPVTRSPKLLPCGHNFCEQCLFSICCHQQYYLLDSINCPTCRAQFSTATARSAPTNYDLCKILENVHRGELNNVTVIRVSDTPKEPRFGPISPKVKRLANKSRDAGHRRCADCSRKLSFKTVSKTARHCVDCGTKGPLFTCLECCVNRHNGHRLFSISQMEAHQLKVLCDVRDVRRRLLSSSEAFDRRFDEIGQKGGSQTLAMKTQKQDLLSTCLSSVDDAIRSVEAMTLARPSALDILRSEQFHGLSRLTKMSAMLEKSVTAEAEPNISVTNTAMSTRRSRLFHRSEDSLPRESLANLLSILPDDSHSKAIASILNGISHKDTVEQRKLSYLKCTQIVTDILYRGASPSDLHVFADALLNSFYQLNVLSRKREDSGKASRANIWKAVQQSYTQLMNLAAKSYPAFHPERVDCVDDLAYICHLFSDVCDQSQATVALVMIEAARARTAENELTEDERRRTDQTLQMIDEHLLELRRLQRLQDLRSKTRVKRKAGGARTIWGRLFGRSIAV